MKKFPKFVLDVLPTLKMGRYSVVLNGELWIGSKETLFTLAGSSCVALQLMIPFVKLLRFLKNILQNAGTFLCNMQIADVNLK